MFDPYEYAADEVSGATLPRGTRFYNPAAYPDTVVRTWE